MRIFVGSMRFWMGVLVLRFIVIGLRCRMGRVWEGSRGWIMCEMVECF